MSNDKHGLKVVPLIDSAGVIRVAHARHPGQAYHTVLLRFSIIQVETSQKESMVPMFVVLDVSLPPISWVYLLLPSANYKVSFVRDWTFSI